MQCPLSVCTCRQVPAWTTPFPPVLTPHPRFLSFVLSILHHRHCCVLFLPRRLSFSFVLVTLFFSFRAYSDFRHSFRDPLHSFLLPFPTAQVYHLSTGHRRLCRLLFFCLDSKPTSSGTPLLCAKSTGPTNIHYSNLFRHSFLHCLRFLLPSRHTPPAVVRLAEPPTDSSTALPDKTSRQTSRPCCAIIGAVHHLPPLDASAFLEIGRAHV